MLLIGIKCWRFPQFIPEEELKAVNGDLRSAILNQGWHWIDIDPYESSIPFLDTAVQSIARKGILEVSATDTAALTQDLLKIHF